MSDDPRALRGLAVELAEAAGGLLREHAAKLGPGAADVATAGVEAKSTPTDLVSEADLAAERLLRGLLAERRPDDGILGEEGTDVEGSTGLRWVVDPLDGTVNFLFGLPQFAVSVAVEDAAGEALAGAVHDPMRGETFAAARGAGATLDGRPVRGSERDDLAHALVATGFAYDAGVRERQAATIARVLPAVRDVRRLGSAALDLVWTACGRCDAYYERGVQRWDVAAGALIAREAGLVTRPLPEADGLPAGLLAAPAALVEPLSALVAD